MIIARIIGSKVICQRFKNSELFLNINGIDYVSEIKYLG